MVEVFKAVLKGLLEVTWPAELISNLNNLPKLGHLNCYKGPVNVHEYLVRALGTQVKGNMLPFHPGKSCNHSEMIASSDIEDTGTSS